MNESAYAVIHDMDAGDLAKIDFEAVKNRILNGEIFVLRAGLQTAGRFQEMLDTSLEGIRRAAGQRVADKVREIGFERIHEVLRDGDIYSVLDSSSALYRERAHLLSREIVGRLFGAKRFYYERSPNVRYHIPFDETQDMDKKAIADFQWSGKIVPHGPHHDSWYYCPPNCLDVWMAVGRVIKGNGLSIFPEVFGEYLPCDEKGVVKRDQRFGLRENFHLDPGDILVFCGEHFHSSEINSTSFTRHVVSFRITFDRPVFIGKSPYRYTYRKAVVGDGVLGRIEERAWNARNGLANLVTDRLRNSDKTRYVIDPTELPICANWEHKPDIDPAVEEYLQSKDIAFDDVQERLGLAPNSVKAVSPRLCAARTSEQIIIFSRHCPHQGADLSAGYMDDSTLYCPWHNLPLDLKTGRSACVALRGLKIVRTWDVADHRARADS
jgi:nitrite reductase/ring-hydroxylating ferredoxin subunit